jgi:hypothetical protein
MGEFALRDEDELVPETRGGSVGDRPLQLAATPVGPTAASDGLREKHENLPSLLRFVQFYFEL